MVTRAALCQAPGAVPPILPDAIHVWVFRLDAPDWRDRLRPGWLSADELAEVGRFAVEPLQRRFVVCRTTLRGILGRYLGRPPGELTFAQNPHGKPYLNAARARGRVRFNVAHCDELALVAVSQRRELGVDLERVRRANDIDDIVAQSFAPAERLAYLRTSPPDRLSAFYRYWTLKEAYLKACGVGRSRPLAEIDVSRAEDRLLCLPDALGTPRPWRCRTLEPAVGYCGALVVEGRAGVSLTTMQLAPDGLDTAGGDS
ncbi:MAG: 4'-phosphopantetheinyl transferase family protein [Candidatus Rokuibacteriota bacterium]